MSLRTESLKSYLLTLAADGEFASKTKILSALAHDLPIVVRELAQTAANQATQVGGDFLRDKLDDIIADVGRRGLKTVLGSVWAKMDAAYDEGVRVQAGQRAREKNARTARRRSR